MPAPVPRKIARWFIGDSPRDTAWRLVIAIAGAALLTWGEWVEHHPPDIAIVALIHFVFMLTAIALVLQIGRWLRRRAKTG